MTPAIAISALLVALQQPAPIESFEPQGFRTQIGVRIDVPVGEVFEAATGDITGWWDHSFQADPAEMVIEPEFGGRFYERFEPGSPDGVLHARVIFVRAPHELRLHGPLGLSGRAVDMVIGWTLAPTDDGAGTQFDIALHITGEIDAELAAVVRSVWVHFIEGRLKPYVEAGCHLTPEEACAAFAE